ncbi:MAG: M48 family metallopeptidase [Bacteroidales bacterium]|nr:M48 family metallopeptidase [Bacteroidales bacterium]
MGFVRKVEFGFGEVSLERNPRSRNLKIKIHPEKGVLVTMPALCTEAYALTFVKNKEAWIRKCLAKTSQVINRITVFNEFTEFSTKFHKLNVQKHNRPALKYEARQGRLTVFYPDFADTSDPKIQHFIRHAIVQTIRFEALNYLPKRTKELAAIFNLEVSGVKVRNNKTRWGSCSGKNSINLNIHLMRLPDRLIDYVILHELAHTRVKSHGKPFWQFLETLLPYARLFDKELNSYHLGYW